MITGLSFVGIVVNDIEEARRNYGRILGVEPRDEDVMEMPGVKTVMFRLGNCSLEILQPTVGPEVAVGGDLARWLRKRGEGFCRLGLWVDNIDGEVNRIEELGARVVETGEYGEIGEEMGARMAFIHPRSASGVLVELDQQI